MGTEKMRVTVAGLREIGAQTRDHVSSPNLAEYTLVVWTSQIDVTLSPNAPDLGAAAHATLGRARVREGGSTVTLRLTGRHFQGLDGAFAMGDLIAACAGPARQIELTVRPWCYRGAPDRGDIPVYDLVEIREAAPTPNGCSCDGRTLLWQGCLCGGYARERLAAEKRGGDDGNDGNGGP